MLPYLEEASITAAPIRYSTCLTDTAASALEQLDRILWLPVYQPKPTYLHGDALASCGGVLAAAGPLGLRGPFSLCTWAGSSSHCGSTFPWTGESGPWKGVLDLALLSSSLPGPDLLSPTPSSPCSISCPGFTCPGGPSSVH